MQPYAHIRSFVTHSNMQPYARKHMFELGIRRSSSGFARRSPVVVTTRRWNAKLEKYFDDDGTGMDPFKEARFNLKDVVPPYLHVHNTHVDLFDSKDDSFRYVALTQLIASERGTVERIYHNLLFDDDTCEEVIIYVHGFNSSITDATENARDIQEATNLPVISYDWASTSTKNFIIPDIFKIGRSYAKDSETAIASVRPLTWLLHFVFAKFKKVNILCHSMGSRIVTECMKGIAHDYYLLVMHNSGVYNAYENMFTKLKSIVYKQPDIDIVRMSDFWYKELSPRRCVQGM